MRWFLFVIKKRWKKILASFFSLFGFYYSVSLFIEYFWGKTVLKDFIGKQSSLIFLCFLFLYISICINWINNTISYTFSSFDTRITLKVGNIIKHKGPYVIPTNSTFDTKMEKEFISKNSIQGSFQNKYYRNNIKQLDDEIEKSLQYVKPTKILARSKSKNKQYSLGTVAVVKDTVYFLASSDINHNGVPVDPTVGTIKESLSGFWDFYLRNGNHLPLGIPLIGTGKAGIKTTHEEIVKMIINSYIDFLQNHTKLLTNELIIYIYPKDTISMNKINMDELKEYLSYCCKYKYYESKVKKDTING